MARCAAAKALMAVAIDHHPDRQGARGFGGRRGAGVAIPQSRVAVASCCPAPYPEPLAAFIEDIGVPEVADSQREETGVLTWKDVIGSEKEQDYFKATLATVREEREAGKVIYPPATEVFNAFKLTELDSVKVVILGQDPYHGPDQAHGLCFSVLPGVRTPPSLVNIYKEMQRDLPGFVTPGHGFLESWATQGVLLLNTVLTVQAGMAHSHAHLGWETFTDRVIERINSHCQGVVFLLWGAHAQKKGRFIDRSRHHVLTAPHPSPLSAHRGFIGCGHFSEANRLLVQQGMSPIDWLSVCHHQPVPA